MSYVITIDQYFGRYGAAHADFTQARQTNAAQLLPVVNAVVAMAVADGVPLVANPATGCLISGSGNGGARPQACPIGAPHSSHKECLAVDIYDPQRLFARWCLQNKERIRSAGVRGMEDPRWTPTWTHLQVVMVKSGNFVFVPDTSAPKAPALPEQL